MPTLWIASLAPVAALLLLMVAAKWSSARAGAASWFVAAIAASSFFGAGLDVIGLATCKGLLLGVYVSYIVWAGVLMYNFAEETGSISGMAAGLGAVTGDDLSQVLLVGWAFVSFLQGVAGFGVPVAVAGPMLTALGVQPVVAASLSLLGHAWAVTFGSMATSFLTLVLVTGIEARPLAQWSAILLGVSCVSTGFLASYMYGGFRALARGFPTVSVAGSAMALSLYLLAAAQSYVIASTVAGLVGCAALALLGRAKGRAKDRTKKIAVEAPPGRRGGFLLAFFPYAALILFSLATSTGPVSTFPSSISLSLPFPETETSLGWKNKAVGSYSAICPLSHPGTVVLEATLAGYVVFRKKGRTKKGMVSRILGKTARQCLFPTISTMTVAMMALVMNESGMTYALAEGVARFGGGFYPILSVFIGVLGCFTTGSNSGSNAMFGAFQRDAARLLGVSEYVLCASQTTGGALGSMIAPAKVVVGTSVTQAAGREGEVIRRNARYCVAVAAISSIAAWAATASLKF
ncbi:MAG: L-lactate permease [Thermoproteota archaeon]